MQEYEDQQRTFSASSVAVDALIVATIIELNKSITLYSEGRLSDGALIRKTKYLVRSITAKASSAAFSVIKKIFSPFAAPEGDSQPHSDFYKDIVRNVREYEASDKGIADLSRLKLRLGFVVSTAGRLAFNLELEEEAKYLSGVGFPVQKVWTANFVDNKPCPVCKRLHNTSVPLGESFQDKIGGRVYQKVYGPPLHPRCRCFLCIYLMNDRPLELDNSTFPDKSFSTADIQGMSKSLFDSFLKVFQRIRRMFRSK